MKVHAMPQPPLQMPDFLQRRVDAFAQQLLNAEGRQAVDFGQPRGEPALVGPDSVSWQIFKNPVAMFVGGVAAVVLELAEPRVVVCGSTPAFALSPCTVCSAPALPRWSPSSARAAWPSG